MESPTQKSTFFIPWHEGELDGGGEREDGGGAGDVVGEGLVLLPLVLELRGQGAEGQHQRHQVALQVAADGAVEREGSKNVCI